MVESTSLVSHDPSKLRPFKFDLKTLGKFIGPGFLVCIAYVDPGNLAGDLEAAQTSGNKLLWLLIIAQVFGFIFQMLSANIGVVSGNNLAELCRKGYKKRPVSIGLWLMTEIAIIGSDIQEVIGSAIALNILFGLPLWAGIVLTVLDAMLVLLIQVYNMNIIEYIFVFFVGVMSICFMINMIKIPKNGVDIVEGMFIPRIPGGAVQAAIGLVGAIIMPHNLYLHSALVDTRKINKAAVNQVRDTCYYYAFDAAFSLIISCFINICIIITFAQISTYKNGKFADITISNAGTALNDIFGGSSGLYIWGLGLLSAGQSATITGTMAGQFVLQGFLNLKVSRAKRSAISRSVAIFPSLMVTFFSNPEQINSNLNILQAIQLPFAVIPLLMFSVKKDLLGIFAISTKSYYFLLFVAFIMVAANIYSIIPSNFDGKHAIDYLFLIGVIVYVVVIVYIYLQEIELTKEDLIVNEDEKEYVQSNLIKEDTLLDEEQDEAHKIDEEQKTVSYNQVQDKVKTSQQDEQLYIPHAEQGYQQQINDS